MEMEMEEWKAVHTLDNNDNIVIKKADRGSCVVVWDQSDDVMEAQRQPNGKTMYKDVNSDKNLIPSLTEKSSGLFESLKHRQLITEEEFNYFRFEFKKTCNLGKLYLSPNMYKQLWNVPGRSVVSHCGVPTEKIAEFLDRLCNP